MGHDLQVGQPHICMFNRVSFLIKQSHFLYVPTSFPMISSTKCFQAGLAFSVAPLSVWSSITFSFLFLFLWADTEIIFSCPVYWYQQWTMKKKYYLVYDAGGTEPQCHSFGNFSVQFIFKICLFWWLIFFSDFDICFFKYLPKSIFDTFNLLKTFFANESNMLLLHFLNVISMA